MRARDDATRDRSSSNANPDLWLSDGKSFLCAGEPWHTFQGGFNRTKLKLACRSEFPRLGRNRVEYEGTDSKFEMNVMCYWIHLRTSRIEFADLKKIAS